MATQETVEDLLFRMHLNADEMDQQFVQISRTLQENLSRINRERNIIDLQTRIDLQGLDRATDATQIFEVRQRSLQRQIELQRQRLSLLNAALQDTRQRTGENSDATQRAQINYEQARLAVRRLETQLQRLNETQNETSTGAANWTERFNNFIRGGQLLSAFDNVRDVIATVTEEVTRLNERFKEMEKTAYDFNLPFDKARDFAMQVRLAGGELQDVGGYLRGLTDALVKGEVDDPEFIALEKYGAEIFDATGRLKDYASILDEVAEAYQRAKAEGSEIEFLQLTGGESGVTDAIQVLERLTEAKEDAAKVVKSGIDPEEMRQGERAINLVTLQLEEFHDTLADLITPATIEFANKLFETFRIGTQFVKDNKEEIQEFGAALSKISEYMPSSLIADNAFKSLKKIFDSDSEAAKNFKKGLEGLNDEVNKGTDKNPLSQYGIQRTNQFRDEIEDLRLELDFVDEYKRKIAELNLWRSRELDGKIYLSDDERLAIEDLYSVKLEKIYRERAEKQNQILEESKQRTAEFIKETNAILADRDLTPWQKEAIEIWNWKQQAVQALDEYRAAVGEKNQFIEEAAAITANALAKEAEAFEKEMDRIKGKNQSLAEKIFEQEHSRRDVDIMRAQKERAEMYNEGIYSAEMIERWYKNRKSEIAKTARDDRNYSKLPDLPSSNYQVQDFYDKLQSQVDSAMSSPDHPAYQLQQQHEQIRQALQGQMQQAFQAPIQQFSQSVQEFSALPEKFSQITVDYGDRAQEVNRSISERQAPQINQTISLNIDLGGAYVFDNELKAKLTDDITTEVANAIRDAVSQGTSEMNYSYGN